MSQSELATEAGVEISIDRPRALQVEGRVRPMRDLRAVRLSGIESSSPFRDVMLPEHPHVRPQAAGQ